MLDPLDGSNNFVLGIPYFSVALALQEQDQIIAAVTHDPSLNRTFTAERGKGAFLNQTQQLVVSVESTLARSTIAHYVGYQEAKTAELEEILNSTVPVKRFLANWSAALDLCLLATGKIEAVVVNFPPDIHFHDYAGGKLIALEAGAKLTDFQGNPEKNIKNSRFLISNGHVHDELLHILQELGY